MGFREQVWALVAAIPRGRVMTYGQIAAICGSPRAARQVGQVAHWGPADLPWQRVVNKQGGLAGGYTTGGRQAHRLDLEAEGVFVSDDYTIDVASLLWWPEDAGSIV
jgi:methylated-DNA-protein-cysteine methyltransferase related protein